MPRIRMSEVNGVAVLLFVFCLLTGVVVAQSTHQQAYAIAGALVGLYFLFAIKVVRQWEKVAVLRLGRLVSVGPLAQYDSESIVDLMTTGTSKRLAAVPAEPSSGSSSEH